MTFLPRNRGNGTWRFMAMWQDQRAAAAVEFDLVATALVFLLMAATDVALAIRTRKEVDNAARAGTEYAAINPSASSAEITGAATSATSLTGATATSTSFCGCATPSGITTQTFGTACAAGGTTGTYVSVTANGQYKPLFPTVWNKYLVSGFVNMSATETTRTNRAIFLLKQQAEFRVDKSGAAAVEFAMIGLALVYLLFGVVDCGQMLWTQNALQYAVEQAARCAVVNTATCGTTSQIQSYAASKVYGLTVSSSVFSVATPSCGTQVSASLPYATGLPVSISVTLTAQSCRPS